MASDSLIRPRTLSAIMTAMNIEQMGSAIIQPNVCIRIAEMMTPTLPNASARICKKTPSIMIERLLESPCEWLCPWASWLWPWPAVWECPCPPLCEWPWWSPLKWLASPRWLYELLILTLIGSSSWEWEWLCPPPPPWLCPWWNAKTPWINKNKLFNKFLWIQQNLFFTYQLSWL